MEAWIPSEEDIQELGEFFGVSRIFDPAIDEEILDDNDVRARNIELYRTQRGRTCEYPGCDEPLRYTRIVPVCRKHESTEFAEVHPAAEPGYHVFPRLPGLKAARKAAGLSARELAQICGRNPWWAFKIEAGRDGAPHELRRLIAAVLNVDEDDLLTGEFPA